MDFILTNSDGFDQLAEGAGYAVISFSRREVDACSIADALDRLMHLTDSRARTEQFERKLVLHFDGFDGDARELFEIPAVCTFFRRLTREWGAWYHFLADEEVGQLPLVFALLCDVDVFRGPHGVGTRFRSPAQVSHAEAHLEQVVRTLYRLHGFSEDRAITTISRAQAQAFGEASD